MTIQKLFLQLKNAMTILLVELNMEIIPNRSNRWRIDHTCADFLGNRIEDPSCNSGAIAFRIAKSLKFFSGGCWIEPSTNPSLFLASKASSMTRRHELNYRQPKVAKRELNRGYWKGEGKRDCHLRLLQETKVCREKEETGARIEIRDHRIAEGNSTDIMLGWGIERELDEWLHCIHWKWIELHN